MDKAQALIGIYRACFYICMAIAVLGLASAVFIFFKFDIRSIVEIRTGRAARRTIEKMAQANAMTGRLRNEDMDFTTGGLQTAHSEQFPAVGETTPLVSERFTAAVEEPKITEPIRPGFQFAITQKVMLIHTDEQL